MSNRFMLAPLTNQQSHVDGTLSEDEFHWLTMRAKGGFGLTMTCASHVQPQGQGFFRQLGIFSDKQIPGHQRLTHEIRKQGSLAIIQLHHGGMRSPEELIGQRPVCPSDNAETGARELSLNEILKCRNDFVQAALRAKKCGYDGIELHGAHGYLLAQFLSPEINRREDDYGGSLENRSRLLFEILWQIRKQCGPDFVLAVRLSPEGFGLNLAEMKTLCLKLVAETEVDFLDLSLWDSFKMPEDESYQSKTLLQHFTDLDLNHVKLTVAGKIRHGEDVNALLNSGVDFVTIGRSAILHHDFPKRVIEDPDFHCVKPPVSRSYLHSEGLGDYFIDYMKRWPNFVLDEAKPS